MTNVCIETEEMYVGMTDMCVRHQGKIVCWCIERDVELEMMALCVYILRYFALLYVLKNTPIPVKWRCVLFVLYMVTFPNPRVDHHCLMFTFIGLVEDLLVGLWSVWKKSLECVRRIRKC